MTALALTIDNIPVNQDEYGRYCLNDLHRASGGAGKNKPSEWLRNKQTLELVAEIEKAGIPAIKTIKGHRDTGTYVVKELVYAYAMWISPEFALKVIRTYDALVTGKMQNQIDELREKFVHVVGLIPKPLKHGYYSAEEDEVIFASKAEGLGARRIARKLNRTVDSVEHRVRWLRERQPNRF